VSFGENVVDLPPHPFVRLLKRWRPREGYAVLLLAWVAVFMLPLAVQTGELLDGIGPAQWLSTVALVVAWTLAHTRLRGWAAAVILALSGLVSTLYWGVYVLRFSPLARQLAARIEWGLVDRGVPAPPVTYWAEQGELLTSFAERTLVWVEGLITGRGGIDNLVVLFFAGLLAWGLAAWAGWWLARHGRAFVGLLPTGALVAQIGYWAPDTLWALVVFIATAGVLLVLTQLWWHVSAWEAQGVDYAEDIRLDVAMTALAIGLVVFALAPAVPSIASGEFSRRFWAVFESPYDRIEDQIGRSFEAVRPARSMIPPSGAAEGGLPRAHLLSGGRELGEKVALRVSVRGNTTGLQLYWRGQTFATYTGRGWEEANTPESQRFEAGEPWQGDPAGADSEAGKAGLPLVARTLVSTVKVADASRAVIYAPGEPVGVDRPYRAIFRAPGELIALAPQSSPDSYTVLSRALPPAPDLGSSMIRDASPPIDRLYLQLPLSLEPRLHDLAAQWTSGAAGSYETALNIERHLREIPYSLDLPTPPAGRELVSWFLFDLRTGYCDYYASAMVVLARLSGIPARLAIGYATGDFDAPTREYVVTELHAHTWPELYFAGLGWVPFEPTAYQSLPDRSAAGSASSEAPDLPHDVPGPEDYEEGLEQLQTAATASTAETRRRTTRQAALVLLNGLAVAWATWLTLDSRSRPSSDGTVSEAFARFQGWGRRLGMRAKLGATPREYTAQLREVVRSMARETSIAPGRAIEAAEVVEQQGTRLTEAYERKLFAPAETSEVEPGGWHPYGPLCAAYGSQGSWGRRRATARRRGPQESSTILLDCVPVCCPKSSFTHPCPKARHET
jgi:transglutaminase-like putative cysteine protease